MRRSARSVSELLAVIKQIKEGGLLRPLTPRGQRSCCVLIDLSLTQTEEIRLFCLFQIFLVLVAVKPEKIRGHVKVSSSSS
ncbi:uncharacterized protein V6R79_019551 [Siganus canaliculatus]